MAMRVTAWPGSRKVTISRKKADSTIAAKVPATHAHGSASDGGTPGRCGSQLTTISAATPRGPIHAPSAPSAKAAAGQRPSAMAPAATTGAGATA